MCHTDVRQAHVLCIGMIQRLLTCSWFQHVYDVACALPSQHFKQIVLAHACDSCTQVID